MEKILQPIHTAEELQTQETETQAQQVPAQAPPASTVNFPVSDSVPLTPTTLQNVSSNAVSASVNPVYSPENSIYPEATHSVAPVGNFMTGSSITPTRSKLPRGIYVIVGLNVISFALSFFRSYNSNLFFTILTVCDLLIVAGLVMRLEAARKIAVALAILTIIISVIDVVGLLAVQSKVNQSVANYHRAVDSLDLTTATARQRTIIASQKAQLAALQKREGAAMNIALINTGIGMIVSLGEAIYLTRPKIASVFEEMKR